MKWICWVTRALSVAVGVYVGYLMYSKGNPMMEYIGWGVGAAAVCMVVTEVLLRLISDAAVVLNIASMCGGVYVGYVLHTRNHDMLDCIVFGLLAAGAGMLLCSMLISFAKGFKWVGDVDRELQPKAWLMLLGAEVVGVAAAALGGTGLMKLLQDWIEAESSYGELLFMMVPWDPRLQGAIVGALLSCVAWQKFAPACVRGLRWIWLLILTVVTGLVAGTAYCLVGGVMTAVLVALLLLLRLLVNIVRNAWDTAVSGVSVSSTSSSSVSSYDDDDDDDADADEYTTCFDPDKKLIKELEGKYSSYEAEKMEEIIRVGKLTGCSEDEIAGKLDEFLRWQHPD